MNIHTDTRFARYADYPPTSWVYDTPECGIEIVEESADCYIVYDLPTNGPGVEVGRYPTVHDAYAIAVLLIPPE